MDKKITITIVVFLLSFFSAYGQIGHSDATPYENARYDLAEETINKIIQKMGVADQLSFSLAMANALESCEGFFEQLECKEKIIYRLCALGNIFSVEGEYLGQSTSIENIYDSNVLQSWRAIGEQYKNKREKIEATKTPLDVDREKKRLESKKGLALIKYQVFKELSKWAEKGEMERREEYEIRINEKCAEKFDELCFDYCNKYWRGKCTLSREGYKYDIDTQTMGMKIYYDNNAEVFLSGTFSISPEKFKNFTLKNLFERYKISAQGFVQYEGDIFPSSLIMNIPYSQEDKAQYIVNFLGGTKINLEIRAEEFQSLPNNVKIVLQNHVFNYDNYWRESSSCKTNEVAQNEWRKMLKNFEDIFGVAISDSEYVAQIIKKEDPQYEYYYPYDIDYIGLNIIKDAITDKFLTGIPNAEGIAEQFFVSCTHNPEEWGIAKYLYCSEDELLNDTIDDARNYVDESVKRIISNFNTRFNDVPACWIVNSKGNKIYDFAEYAKIYIENHRRLSEIYYGSYGRKWRNTGDCIGFLENLDSIVGKITKGTLTTNEYLHR